MKPTLCILFLAASCLGQSTDSINIGAGVNIGSGVKIGIEAPAGEQTYRLLDDQQQVMTDESGNNILITAT